MPDGFVMQRAEAFGNLAADVDTEGQISPISLSHPLVWKPASPWMGSSFATENPLATNSTMPWVGRLPAFPSSPHKLSFAAIRTRSARQRAFIFRIT
jgi:hypothetical protein